MLVILLSVGAALLALPGLARPMGRRAAPNEWARLCVLALAGGAALIELTLLLYAAPTVLRATGAPLLASLCERMLGPLVPGGGAIGSSAAVAAVALPAMAATGVRRALRDRRALQCEPGLGDHQDRGRYELVVLPAADIVAVSVPGFARGQVLISDGLIDTLESAELEAVLRHEAAHLAWRHHRHLLLATALEHALPYFPPLRRSTETLRLTLERWADEEAAGADPESRRVLRHAILDVAGALVAAPSIAAFGGAVTVMERAAALGAPAPHPSRLAHGVLYLPGAALAGVAALALGTWAVNAEQVVAMAGTCY